MGTCARYNVWSETLNLPGLLSCTKAKSKIGALSSVAFRYSPQPAVQPAACLSGRQILPFSPYAMSMELLSRQTQQHVITFCNFTSLCILTASTLRLTPPVYFQTSWPAALEHTAASSLALSVMKKVYSLKKAQTHMVQHLICFKSLKSQVEKPSLSHMLRSWDGDFSRKRVFCLPLKAAALPLM